MAAAMIVDFIVKEIESDFLSERSKEKDPRNDEIGLRKRIRKGVCWCMSFCVCMLLVERSRPPIYTSYGYRARRLLEMVT